MDEEIDLNLKNGFELINGGENVRSRKRGFRNEMLKKKTSSNTRFQVLKKDQKKKTCKPLKKHKAGTKRYELHKLAKKQKYG